MYFEVFINDFSRLGDIIAAELSDSSEGSLIYSAIQLSEDANPMFRAQMQISSLMAINEQMLKESHLRSWVEPYRALTEERDEVTGIIMAGNLPLVGFHDFLSCLAAGFKAEIKLSGRDKFLLPAIYKILCGVNSFWRERIVFTDTLSDKISMLIATGSDQTVRSVGGVFKNIPQLLRGTRSSFAILDGSEERDLLEKLCDDMFLYFGIGCRSVSTLIVPQGFDFTPLLESARRYSYLGENNDYSSAYRYNKTILIMEEREFVDGGFFLLQKGASFPPPLSVTGVVEYREKDEIEAFVKMNENRIQAIVSSAEGEGFIPPGEAQHPKLNQYADNINTLDFLLKNISK